MRLAHSFCVRRREGLQAQAQTPAQPHALREAKIAERPEALATPQAPTAGLALVCALQAQRAARLGPGPAWPGAACRGCRGATKGVRAGRGMLAAQRPPSTPRRPSAGREARLPLLLATSAACSRRSALWIVSRSRRSQQGHCKRCRLEQTNSRRRDMKHENHVFLRRQPPLKLTTCGCCSRIGTGRHPLLNRTERHYIPHPLLSSWKYQEIGCVGVPWTLNTPTPFGLSGHVGCQG